MRQLILTFGLTLINIFVVGQDTFTLEGKLKLCYDKTFWTGTFKKFKVTLVDLEPHYVVGQEITVNELGEFKFDNLKPSNYKITTYLFEPSDIIIKVDNDIMDVILCVDNAFRPVPQDTLDTFINKAEKDIDENNLKIYHLSAGLAIQRKSFDRRNKRLMRKFNFQIETVSCLLVLDRQSFIYQEKCLTYNKVAEGYLDKKYGTSWRRAVK